MCCRLSHPASLPTHAFPLHALHPSLPSVCGVCTSSLAVPLSAAATEECEKVECEPLISPVTDSIKCVAGVLCAGLQGEVEIYMI